MSALRLNSSLIILLVACSMARATEFAVLSPQSWEAFTPQGKEVDAIYGDYVLRNDKIIAVVAQPLTTRNANMTVRNVGGCVIDLTDRNAQNDQLSAYYPAAARYPMTSPTRVRLAIDGQTVEKLPVQPVSGRTVTLELDADQTDGKPQLTVRYVLADGSPHLVVDTVYRNSAAQVVSDELSDAIRADRTFTFQFDPATHCFFAEDEWFRQAYGIVIDGYEIKGTGQRGTLLQLVKDGTNKLTLQPGASHTVTRKVFPANSLLAARGTAAELAGSPAAITTIRAVDSAPVPQARLTLKRDGQPYATGRTDARGELAFALPRGTYSGEVESIDGRQATIELSGSQTESRVIELKPAGYVVATITDAGGGPIPAKISFTGKDGTKDPNWGPDSGEVAVKNAYYTPNGSFKQVIAPGKYDVIVSYGPEYDAVFTSIDVAVGGTAELKASLNRSVDTRGWISADFHSHSTPSGDNTSSQLGRVLNLLCEHVEFAPCTEHNRIDTYVPILKRLQVEHRMATCTGMELTGNPLPINHQNAFPLHHHPHTQDGGGPVTSTDPITQVERLAFWDNKSDKLVQMNHPTLPQILGDRDLDGKPDQGFEQMFGFVDVIEVHPPQGIFQPPQKAANGQLDRNPIFHWMQMLNLGYRLPGVMNTDSHYNYHESGFFRNFIQSSTDDPAKVNVMEMVHNSEHGRVVVSTGPFMTVTARTGGGVPVGPGSDLAAGDGRVELAVRVQCPNWFDVNRVQVFINGRPSSEATFTRRTTPKYFSDGVLRFDAAFPIGLKTDAHLIVATIGEDLQLGPVMGPEHGKKPPAAVVNPIFVDVDGGGFKPNGDLLDVPLLLETNRAITQPQTR
jgi:hypothetical protein